MAYDLELADRIRKVLRGERGLSEKHMFGGLAFLIDEKIAVTASSKGGLLLRIDPTQTVFLGSEPHVRPAEMRGREMDGWLRVDTEVIRTDDELRGWVKHGVAYARSLSTRETRHATAGHSRDELAVERPHSHPSAAPTMGK